MKFPELPLFDYAATRAFSYLSITCESLPKYLFSL